MGYDAQSRNRVLMLDYQIRELVRERSAAAARLRESCDHARTIELREDPAKAFGSDRRLCVICGATRLRRECQNGTYDAFGAVVETIVTINTDRVPDELRLRWHIDAFAAAVEREPAPILVPA